jgi:tetratricopeptide (TPR) repeat protein
MKRVRWQPFLPALLALIAHAGAVGNPFVFDDFQGILRNESIRHLGNLRWILAGSRRPLTNLSYALDFSLWGAAPFGYHLTNLALHALNSLLAYLLVRRVAADARPPAQLGASPLVVNTPDRAALLASSLFAVHPLLTEAVGYASARAGLLAATCLLLGALALRRSVEPNGRRWFAAGILLWILGAAGKETGALLPLLFLAWDRLLLDGDALARRARLLRLHLPLLALTGAIALFRLASYLGREAGFTRSPWAQLLTQSNVLFRYLGLFALPVRQSVLHDVATLGPTDPLGLLALGALAALLAALWRYRKSAPLAVFGAAWFLLLLAPSSLVPLGQNMAEHRVYEASLGLFLAAGDGLARLASRRPIRIALPLAVAGLLVASSLRHRVWASPVSLWSDAAAKAPRSWAAHWALADALREAGECNAAVPEYRRALELRPGDRRVRRNLAICLAEVGPFDEGYALLAEELTAAPRDVGALINLARIEWARENFPAARGHFEQARALCQGPAAEVQRDDCTRAAAFIVSFPPEP